jgi:hypothetical protein
MFEKWELAKTKYYLREGGIVGITLGGLVGITLN